MPEVCGRLVLCIHPGPAPGIHARLALHILSFHLLAWMLTPTSQPWMGQPPLNGGPRPSPSAFSLAMVMHRYAKPWSSLLSHHLGHAVPHQTPASEPPALLHYPQATPLARRAHARHAKAAAGMGGTDIPAHRASVLQQLQPCRQRTVPDLATQRYTPPWLQGAGCRGAGHKHWQTPGREQWRGSQHGWGAPRASLSHMQGKLAGSLLLEGHRGAKRARGSLPALALLVLGERHLHIGCLPIWLYLQELKEEQRLLPGQRQEGAGRAPAALPRHPSLSGRRVSNLFLGTSGSGDSTSAHRQHRPGPATLAAWEALLVLPRVFRAVI